MLGCEGFGLGGVLTKSQPRAKKIGDYIYHPDSVLGRGAYSTVHEGVNSSTHQRVAIKAINLAPLKSTQLSTLLYQETQLISQLAHPNIVKYIKLMKSENNYYIIMERCEPSTLQSLVTERRQGRASNSCDSVLKQEEIESIVYGLFLGLKYLSSKNILHRDLKSANILLTKEGTPKITDFGFATRAFSEFVDSVFVGTPLYTAPEAFLEQRYGPKTDIWSFGVIVYEMVFGAPPLENCKSQQQFLGSLVEPLELQKADINLFKAESGLLEMMQGCLQPNHFERWNIDKLSSCKYIQKLIRQNTQIEQAQYSQKTPSKSPRRAANSKYNEAFSHLYSYMSEELGKSSRRVDNSKSNSKNRVEDQRSSGWGQSSICSKAQNNNKNSTETKVKTKNKTDKSQKTELSKNKFHLSSFSGIKDSFLSSAFKGISTVRKDSFKGYPQSSNSSVSNSSRNNHHSFRANPRNETQNQNQIFQKSYKTAGQRFETELSYELNINNNNNININREDISFSRLRSPSPSHVDPLCSYYSTFDPKDQIRLTHQPKMAQQKIQPVKKIIYHSTCQTEYSHNTQPRALRSPISPRVPYMIYRTPAHHQQQSFPTNDEIFRIKHLLLRYSEIIKLMHYCRLVHRVLEFPKYYSQVLSAWLSTVISCLCEQMDDDRQYLHLKKTTPNVGDEHLHSLRSVLEKYRAKFVFSALERQGPISMKEVQKCIAGFLCSEQRASKERELLRVLAEETAVVRRCCLRGNFQELQNTSKCEEVLREHWLHSSNERYKPEFFRF